MEQILVTINPSPAELIISLKAFLNDRARIVHNLYNSLSDGEIHPLVFEHCSSTTCSAVRELLKKEI